MGVIIVIVVWLAFAATAAGAARSKGRYWVGWAFAGLLLGPLVLLAAVLVPPPKATCPHCAARIPLEANACRYCERDID